MADFWTKSNFSVALETAFGTVNVTDGDYQGLKWRTPKVDLDAETFEFDLMTGQVGAAPIRITGARKAKVSISAPLEAFITGYAPATDTPGTAACVPPWFALAANAIGGNVDAYVAETNAEFWMAKKGIWTQGNKYVVDGVASATNTSITAGVAANIWEDATVDARIGNFVATYKAAVLSTVQAGWIKDYDAATEKVTLFGASKNTINDPDAEIAPTITAWLSSAAPRSLSMRHLGEDALACKQLTGMMPDSIKWKFTPGQVGDVEFSFRGYGFEDFPSKGGYAIPPLPLYAANTFETAPKFTNELSARLMVNGAAQCNWQDLEIEWVPQIEENVCFGSGIGGVSGLRYVDQIIKCRFFAPWSDDDTYHIDDGAWTATTTARSQNVWQYRLESHTTISVVVEACPSIGKCISFLMPSLQVVSAKWEQKGKTWGYSIECESSTYSGDAATGVIQTGTPETAATSAMNSIFRIGMA